MKTYRSSFKAVRGSAFITVVVLIGVMAILTASILRYTVNERRSNERQRLILRARNMAENAALYASEQITTKLYRLRNLSSRQFSEGSNQIYPLPNSVLDTTFSNPSDVEVYAGLRNATALALVTETSNPNYGLQISTAEVPIIAKSTMTHPAAGTVTAYAEQSLQITEIPLFQFAIFYNQDLEFSPGADMEIAGPVHANGNLIARSQTGFNNTIQFRDRVTASGGFFAHTGYKGSIYNEYGNADSGPGGNGALYFQKPNGTVTNIYGSSIWRDHRYGTSSVTTTTLNQFKTFATSTYAGNLRTTVHGATDLVLPGIDDTASNNGRYIIEPAFTSDTAGMIQNKFSRRSGLYIIVNPDDEERPGILPDATTVSMRARSYRCWLNTVNADGTHSLYEVVLPGQPSYGALNAVVNKLPNAFRTDTSIGHNQVLRIPKGGGGDRADTGYAVNTPSFTAFSDAFFYDLRRATNSNGYPFNRSSNPFTPRPISKIDFDMTRFKMTVERTLLGNTASTIYSPARPNATNWNSSILNASADPASYGLGLGSSFNVFGGVEAIDAVQKTQAAVYAPTQLTISSTRQTGTSGTPTGYAGRFFIAETSDSSPFTTSAWTDWYTSPADEVSTTYTPRSGSTAIRVRQYVPGTTTSNVGSSRLLDEQIIPIIDDTTTTVRASLSSDTFIVPSTSNTGGFLLTSASTEMRVYVGGVDDTANWSFSINAIAPSSSSTGGFGATSGSILSSGTYGNGAGHNRFWLTSISSASGTTSGTVTIRATKGATTIDRVFTWKKQSGIANLSSNTNQSTYWITAASSAQPDPYKIYFVTANPETDMPVPVTASSLFSSSSVSPWFDGITVYIHSAQAELKTMTGTTPNRLDSGVRLINGRGPAVSMTTSGYTGLSIGTNDALYIVGHFNADGEVNSTSSSTSNPGGYSARYRESTSEYLTALMADAITVLSQPIFARSGSGTAGSPYVYTQSSGWCDALSANTRSEQGGGNPYTTSWQTTNPGSSNTMDGINNGVVPPPTPFQGSTPAYAGSSRDYKFSPTVTEVSACLLTGIVPTDSHQHSGGVHNYPRLLEAWQGTGLYIRGSMVAMFNSEVATEPWSIRIYTGAGRYWGLHQSLRDPAHDVPLEPILLNAQRQRYSELSAAEYANLKTIIENL